MLVFTAAPLSRGKNTWRLALGLCLDLLTGTLEVPLPQEARWYKRLLRSLLRG